MRIISMKWDIKKDDFGGNYDTILQEGFKACENEQRGFLGKQ